MSSKHVHFDPKLGPITMYKKVGDSTLAMFKRDENSATKYGYVKTITSPESATVYKYGYVKTTTCPESATVYRR